MYKYQSNYMGELLPTLKEVIKATYCYIRYIKPFEFKMFSWAYNRKGW